jgi:hypothetical protein
MQRVCYRFDWKIFKEAVETDLEELLPSGCTKVTEDKARAACKYLQTALVLSGACARYLFVESAI